MVPSGYCHRKLFGYFPLCSLQRFNALRAFASRAPSKLHRTRRPLRFPSLRFSQVPLALRLSVRFALARFASRSQFKTLPSLFLSSLCLPVLHRSSDFPAPQLFHWLSDQALGRLVSPSSTRYRASTDDLSTWSSPRGLTRFRDGNSLLWVGFTLRCLQRLSSPHFASQLCRWHDNCCTRGASIPVLSY